MRSKIIAGALIAAVICSGCMTENEYHLRKLQMDNQAKHQQVYSPWEAEGPVTITVSQGGKVRVRSQTQPYAPIPVPDGQAYQTGLLKTAMGVGAATAVGLKAMDKGDTTIHNHTPAKEVAP